MAEEPIRKEDIIDISGTQESINELIKTLENLSQVMRKDLKESADILEKSLQGVNAATKEGQERIKSAATESENLAAQQREMSKIDKETVQLKARLNALNSDEANEVAKLKVAIEGKNKAMKDAAKLDDSSEGSVNKMRAKLKELTAEYNKLSPAIREKAAPAINKLTDELKKAESAIGNNTRNVGNYSNALKGMGTKIMDSIKSFSVYAVAVRVAAEVFDKLKEAFMSTVDGMNIMNVVGEAQKQMFYDLATAGKINWDNMKNAAEAAVVMNKIRAGDREDMVEFAKLEREITKLEYEAANKTKSNTEQKEALNKAIERQNSLSDKRIADVQEELVALELVLAKQPRNEKLLNKQAELITKIIQLDEQRFSSSRRNEARASAFEKAETDRIQKQYDDLMKAADDEIQILRDRDAKIKSDRDKEQKQILDTETKLWGKQNKLMSESDEKRLTQFQLLQKRMIDTDKATGDQLVAANKKVNDDKTAQDKKALDDKKQRDNAMINDSFNAISGSLDNLASLYEANKQRELSAAGDNAAAREAIEKKYAKRQQALNIGQALMNSAMAITEIWRKWAAFPVYAGILTGIATAQMITQIAVIKSQKFARGGSGVLDGPVHASGGIPIPGVGEAEGGEHFSITSRSMTSHYGPKVLDAISNSINQGKFFEVWSNVNKSMDSDPYTKKMYELMQKTPTTYIDSNGCTVKEYPDGRTFVIKKFNQN